MARGQVLVEMFIGLSLLLLVLAVWQQHTKQAAATNQQALVSARDVIWARELDEEKASVSEDYFGAEASGKLLNEAGKLVKLDFETKNFRHTNSPTEDAQHADYRMARLTDVWAPETDEHLAGRPRSLVMNTVLDASIVRWVQDLIAYIPSMREFSSDSLIFGHIDTDVVPEDKLIKVPYR